MSTTTSLPSQRTGLARLWKRELPHYPGNAKRIFNLGLVTAVAIMMYYQYFLTASLSAHILHDFHISFLFWINLAVLGNVLGAAASYFGGFADRYGRANMIVVCVFIIAGLGVFGIPNAHTGAQFMTMNILVGIVEGVALVATPALMRDFSPQVSRGKAMASWALGPVVASLLVSAAVSSAGDSLPWKDHYVIAGSIGLAIGVVALLGLRELSPALRDQRMVSAHDRALVEARAKGIDVEASLQHPYRQLLKFNIVGSTLGYSLAMIINFVLLAFLPIMFQTAFGYSTGTANSLGNWLWGAAAVTLVVTGTLSDKLRVRKPFMLTGAALAGVLITVLATHIVDSSSTYTTFAWVLAGIGVAIGLMNASFMAAFTETVEDRNPALAATGLSVWGMIFRFVGALTLFIGPHVVGAVTTIAQQGPAVKAFATGTAPTLTAEQNATVKAIATDPTIAVKVKTAATKYAPELATAAKIDPATKAALQANPTDKAVQVKAVADVAGLPVPTVAQTLAAGAIAKTGHATPAQLAVLAANGPKVQAAAAQLAALGKVPAADKALLATWGPKLKDPQVQASLVYLKDHAPAVKQAMSEAPGEWQNMLWIALGGQIVFIPAIFLLVGGWSSRRARREEAEHEAWLQAELAKSKRELAMA